MAPALSLAGPPRRYRSAANSCCCAPSFSQLTREARRDVNGGEGDGAARRGVSGFVEIEWRREDKKRE